MIDRAAIRRLLAQLDDAIARRPYEDVEGDAAEAEREVADREIVRLRRAIEQAREGDG